MALDTALDLITFFQFIQGLTFVVMVAFATTRFIFSGMLGMAEDDNPLLVFFLRWVFHLNGFCKLPRVDTESHEDQCHGDNAC